MTSLGRECFARCFSLESIAVDAKNPRYDSREGCNAIIETESNTMLAGCKNTLIPSSVTSLGDYCFYGSSLASIEIPSFVTSIGSACFVECSSLESIVVDANNPCYDSRKGCNAIIETKSNTMVAGCKNTVIPPSVTSLGDGCFACCYDLTSIEIPSSVTSLGNYCFSDCYSLKTVICKMENVISGNFFDYCYGNVPFLFPFEEATLYVPEHLLETYKSKYPWSDFGTILPLAEEPEMGVNDIPKSDLSLRSSNGNVILSGLADGTPVSYYNAEGRMLGKTIINDGSASFSVKPNSIVIVKAGRQSAKVHVK